MKKNWLFLLLLLLISGLYFGCSKSSSTDTLIGNWSEPGEITGVGRSGAVCFTIGDSVYYGLGYNQYNPKIKYLLDFYKYDYAKNQFIKIADFQGVGRSDAVAFSVNGKGYVGTGFNGDLSSSNYLNDFWEYTPATNQWRKVAHLPAESLDPNNLGRRNAVAFSIANNGYVGSGYSGNYLKDFWKFTPGADSGVWESVAGLPFPRSNAVAFVIDNKGYVVTGDNNGSYNHDSGADRFYRYNPASNAWEQLRDIANTSTSTYDDSYNIIRSNAVALVWNTGTQSKAYITTGVMSSVRGDTWEYDPSTDLWVQKTSFEGVARSNAFGFSVGNRIYVATGKNGSLYYSDMWEFKPNDTYDANN